MSLYIHLLISVVFPDEDYAMRRYAVSIDLNDRRMTRFDPDFWQHWQHRFARDMLSAILCEDWILDQDHIIVNVERIDGAVQWGPEK